MYFKCELSPFLHLFHILHIGCDIEDIQIGISAGALHDHSFLEFVDGKGWCRWNTEELLYVPFTSHVPCCLSPTTPSFQQLQRQFQLDPELYVTLSNISFSVDEKIGSLSKKAISGIKDTYHGLTQNLRQSFIQASIEEENREEISPSSPIPIAALSPEIVEDPKMVITDKLKTIDMNHYQAHSRLFTDFEALPSDNSHTNELYTELTKQFFHDSIELPEEYLQSIHLMTSIESRSSSPWVPTSPNLTSRILTMYSYSFYVLIYSITDWSALISSCWNITIPFNPI